MTNRISENSNCRRLITKGYFKPIKTNFSAVGTSLDDFLYSIGAYFIKTVALFSIYSHIFSTEIVLSCQIDSARNSVSATFWESLAYILCISC